MSCGSDKTVLAEGPLCKVEGSRGPVLFGVVGLVAFPLAGAALVAHLVEPLTFVAISMLSLVLFGAAMMKLHRA